MYSDLYQMLSSQEVVVVLYDNCNLCLLPLYYGIGLLACYTPASFQFMNNELADDHLLTFLF